MSFITNDYRCMKCDKIDERMVLRSETGNQKCDFDYCGGDMKQLIGGPITTFRFGDRSAIKSRKAVSLRDKGSSP